MGKPIFEYLVTYEQRGNAGVTSDNVAAFNKREAKRLAREILKAGKILKIINTGSIGSAD